MTDQANRIYALDLLNRAGTAYDVRDIAVVASIIPLIEGDVVAAIERPTLIGSDGAARAIIATRIGTGCHRPNSEPPGSLTSRPGQPAAAPAPVHAGGGGLSGE